MNKSNGFVRTSATLRRPDLMSHDKMSKRRRKAYNNSILKAVAVEDKFKLLSSIKKGGNETGGTFGGVAPEREPSPTMPLHELRTIKQKFNPRNQRFQHSQIDPIIIRGSQNVDVNHLVYRKKDFK